jgi:uncharacterized protein YkwD
MKYAKHTVVAVAVSMFLAACGGGGGSSPPSSTTTPSQPTAPVVVPADLQASVPALTYSANSPEYAFVTALNQFRAQVGLGLLAQNALLDKSAQNHLQYVVTNDAANGGTVNMETIDPATGLPMYHVEQASKPGFTGVVPADRAKAVGYNGAYVGEEISFAGGKGGQVALAGLVSTVYHRAGLMFQGLREVGVAAGQDRSQTFTLEFGYVTPQSNASDFLAVYPVDKQTSVGRYAGVEAPNPFPDLSTSNSDFPTKTGYPVSVVSKEGTTLEVLTFTITETGTAAPLSARQMMAANDPNKYLGSNVAFLVANGTLKANTTYNVSFSGRVNNVVVSKSWSFTTGN